MGPDELPDNPLVAPDGPLLEQALRQAQVNLLRYQELFDFAPDGYLITDLHAVIQEANHAAAAMLGTRKELLRDQPLYFYVAPPDRRTFSANLAALDARPPGRLHWEMRLSPPRHAALQVLVTAVAAPADRGQATVLRWTLRDVTQRWQAEETLRTEKQLFDSLIEMAAAAILVLDPNRRILRANPYLCSVSGYRRKELEGRPMSDLLSAQEQSPAIPSESALGRDHAAYSLRTKEGRTRTMMLSLRPLASPAEPGAAFVVVGIDITELHEAQRRALQAERLATIGQTVTTLAHEGRNVLQRAQGCLARLKWRLEGRPEELDLVERCRLALDDLTRLFDDVRSYAAPIKLDLHACDLGQTWREAWAQVIGQHPGRDAQMQEDLQTLDMECEGDPFRLAQVFANLFANALDACPGPVRVTISCQDTSLGDRPAVRIVVGDNGPGFSAEQRQRAQEPFFTTKPKGTGLGLAIARRILHAHNGVLDIEANHQGGARIALALPRKQSKAGAV